MERIDFTGMDPELRTHVRRLAAARARFWRERVAPAVVHLIESGHRGWELWNPESALVAAVCGRSWMRGPQQVRFVGVRTSCSEEVHWIAPLEDCATDARSTRRLIAWIARYIAMREALTVVLGRAPRLDGGPNIYPWGWMRRASWRDRLEPYEWRALMDRREHRRRIDLDIEGRR